MIGIIRRRHRTCRLTLTGVLLLLACLLVASVAASATDVSPALLTASDLPSGWEVLDRSAAAPGSQTWCPEGEAMPAPAIASAARSFSSGAMDQILYHDVLLFDNGGATAALAAIRAELAGCSWEETGADAVPMHFQLSAPERLALGDEAIVRRLDATWEGMVVRAEIIVVRRGDSVAILTHAAFGSGDAATESALTERLAERAAERLATVSGAR